MNAVLRFAPSPTGLLHIGNLRAVLTNWLLARRLGGVFLLRMDDTDTERSRPELATAIEEDLRWLGLTWDQFARQSDRLDRYREAADQLRAAGRLYPCYETAEELGLKRAALLAQGRPPIYDRSALRLAPADIERLEGAGRRPHWRFQLEAADIQWDDAIQGQKHFHGRDLSDPVLIREDGQPLYTISSVVDDVDFAVTHIIRGEDHVANTAVQIQLFQALGGKVPSFAHFPLIADVGGQGLSKRLGSRSLRSLREEEGIEPLALLSYLARLGTSDSIAAAASLDELVAGVDLSKYGRGTPKFDPDELQRLNAQVLHVTPFAVARDRLRLLGIDAALDERAIPFWEAVRGNLGRLAEVSEWWPVVAGEVATVAADPAFAEVAAELLPAEPWNSETWRAWTQNIKERTGLKGKALFMPLRLALTGRDHGPELQALLPLIGRQKVLARLLRQEG